MPGLSISIFKHHLNAKFAEKDNAKFRKESLFFAASLRFLVLFAFTTMHEVLAFEVGKVELIIIIFLQYFVYRQGKRIAE